MHNVKTRISKALFGIIKNHLDKRKPMPHLQTEVLLLWILICRCKCNAMRAPIYYFIETDKMIVKFIWQCKKLKTVKTILKTKKIILRLILTNLKTLLQNFNNHDNVVLV